MLLFDEPELFDELEGADDEVALDDDSDEEATVKR